MIPSFYTKGLEVTYKVYLTLTNGFVEAQFIGFKSFFFKFVKIHLLIHLPSRSISIPPPFPRSIWHIQKFWPFQEFLCVHGFKWITQKRGLVHCTMSKVSSKSSLPNLERTSRTIITSGCNNFSANSFEWLAMFLTITAPRYCTSLSVLLSRKQRISFHSVAYW